MNYQSTADTIDRICEVFNIKPIDLLLPDSHNDERDLINTINLKLRNYNYSDLMKINELLDILNKEY